jgi:hypothetical protein
METAAGCGALYPHPSTSVKHPDRGAGPAAAWPGRAPRHPAGRIHRRMKTMRIHPPADRRTQTAGIAGAAVLSIQITGR